MEREVRQAKRDVDPDAIGEAQANLRKHVGETGITRRPYREQLPFADGGDANPRGRTKPTTPGKGSITVPPGVKPVPHELETAKRLQQHGYEITFNRLSTRPGIKNPDITMNSQVWGDKKPSRVVSEEHH